MGVLDNFLNFMKLNDEDDYDDDLFDDDDFEEDKPKKGLFKRDMKYDFDDDDYDFEESKTRTARTSSASKVTPMRQPARKPSMEVCVIKPTTVDDAREITETL